MASTLTTSINLVGDPSLGGWVITFAYLLAVILCFVKYQQQKISAQPVMFWLMLGVFLLFIGLNKQLDLQTLFIMTMKSLSKTYGWYEQRKTYQVAFIAILMIGFVTALIIARIVLYQSWLNQKRVWFGIALLFFFIVLRAATFSKLNSFSSELFFGFSVHSMLELAIVSFLIVSIYLADNNSGKLMNLVIHEGDNVFCPKCSRLSKLNATTSMSLKCVHCGNEYTATIQKS